MTSTFDNVHVYRFALSKAYMSSGEYNQGIFHDTLEYVIIPVVGSHNIEEIKAEGYGQVAAYILCSDEQALMLKLSIPQEVVMEKR